MIDRVLLIISGVGVGLSATALCALLGLQSRNWSTLATINVSVGVAAALTGSTVVKHYRQATQQQSIQPSDLDRAIGAVSERYALEADRTSVLTALYELRDEVHGKR
ncbi:MAG TPA: hypothetical protein V6C65_33365 [Allocoleopsis sp.]